MGARYSVWSELTRTSPTAREKCLRPLGQDQGREVRSKLILQLFLLTPRSRPRSRSSTTRRPKQAFLAKTYDENARRSERDPRIIFRTPADASAATAAGVEPLGSSFFSLSTVKCTYRKWTASASASRRPPSREKCKCTHVVHPRDQPSAVFSKTSSRVRDLIILVPRSGPMVGSAGDGGVAGRSTDGFSVHLDTHWDLAAAIFLCIPLLIRIGIPSDRRHCIR